MGKHDDGKGPQDKELDISEVVPDLDQKREAVGGHAGESTDGGK